MVTEPSYYSRWACNGFRSLLKAGEPVWEEVRSNEDERPATWEEGRQ